MPNPGVIAIPFNVQKLAAIVQFSSEKDMPLADVLLAQAYRERKLRSLSVGDVVRVGNRWFTVASAGWTEVKAAELQILDTEAAEAAVREMFQMTSDEELTVTVPLS